MVWFLLLLMATACAAHGSPNTANLEDKVFIFPKESPSYRAKLFSSIYTFSAMTVCLRVKTDLCRDHSLFSLATSHATDAFSIFWDNDNDLFLIEINDVKVKFRGLKYDPNKWHSICVTWSSASKLVQMWIDGHYTVLKRVGGGYINHPCIIVGQDQDNYCGGFDQHQSFVGEMCDVHVWNYVLGVCDILYYMSYQNFCPGNAVNWRHLTYHITGGVRVDYKQICLQKCRGDECRHLSKTDDCHCKNLDIPNCGCHASW